MNEAETRAELIDIQLRQVGWGKVEDSKILRERNVYKNTNGVKITYGRIQVGGKRAKPNYMPKNLNLETTYSANGKEIYKFV